MWIIVLLSIFLAPSIMGHFCNYVEEISATPLTISSPNYPNKYEPNTNCMWTTSTFTAYKLKLTCSVVDIPYAVDIDGSIGNILEADIDLCLMDYLEISRSGSENFADGIKYCGKNLFTVTSDANKMNIRLKTGPLSFKGKFTCTLERIPNPCSCGYHKTSRIVGGEETGVNEYPMMAGIVDSAERSIFCGVTIITTTAGLTAGSCFTNRPINTLSLVVGEHDVTTDAETSSTAYLNIKSAICYNGCTGSITSPNAIDLALAFTDTDIELTAGVGLACLPYAFQGNSFDGNTVTALGWGLLEFGGAKATVLQKVQLNVMAHGECETYYDLSEKNMCTYSPGKDTCQMDSGGSLLYTRPDNGRVYVVGVISNLVQCARDKPDVETQVTSFLNWIEANTHEEFCKN